MIYNFICFTLKACSISFSSYILYKNGMYFINKKIFYKTVFNQDG